MAETYRISSSFMVKFIPSRSLSTVGKSKTPTRSLTAKLTNKLLTDPESIRMASTDFGNIVQEIPLGILQPSCCEEIVDLVRAAYSDDNSSVLFPIAARGHGHSVRGQALARGGVVVDMTSLASKQGGTGGGAAIAVSWSALLGHYADVGGGQLWRDLLEETLGHGLAPVSWTDYLYLTVGGTLSNGGISGQTFRYGPQISNVHEMDVITGMNAMKSFDFSSSDFFSSLSLRASYFDIERVM